MAAVGSLASLDTTAPRRRTLRTQAWIVLIFLAAAALRLVALPDAPPGMTHDEADHGITAWSIVNGTRAIYFTIGYGREPLYDYATALVMAGTGPRIFAARLTSAYISLFLIAAVYAWTRRAFGNSTALLTAAGLAVGFWPVMAGRQALRSIALPALFSLAILFFWIALVHGTGQRHQTAPEKRIIRWRASSIYSIIAGLFLGLSIYTYIPARVMWLALPLLAGYWWLVMRSESVDGPARALIRMLGLTLLTAATVVVPLVIHLGMNPELEVRLNELSAPVRAAASGDFGPMWSNTVGSLRLFTIEGDPTWRYNIPGKPFLGPLMGVLFYIGTGMAAWLAIAAVKQRRFSEKSGFAEWNGPGAFLALVWLGLGISPVLITGPGLSTTQAIGVLPVLYLFPALAMTASFNALRRRVKHPPSVGTPAGDDSPTGWWAMAGSLIAVMLFVSVATLTVRDYFGTWVNHPEVRVQYETTMVTALEYLNGHNAGAASVSTITPGPFHTPAVAQLTLHRPDIRTVWFDGRQSLLLPDDAQSSLVIPGFTPLPPEIATYVANLDLETEIPLRPDDLDRPIRVYTLNGQATALDSLAPMRTETTNGSLPVVFGEHIELLGFLLPPASARPGETIPLLTAWRFRQSLPGAMLFAHVDGSGRVLAQADSLGAPGESWVAGDVLLQLHEISIPPDAPPGSYPVVVGVYTQPDGRRLSIAGRTDQLPLATITISHE